MANTIAAPNGTVGAIDECACFTGWYGFLHPLSVLMYGLPSYIIVELLWLVLRALLKKVCSSGNAPTSVQLGTPFPAAGETTLLLNGGGETDSRAEEDGRQTAETEVDAPTDPEPTASAELRRPPVPPPDATVNKRKIAPFPLARPLKAAALSEVFNSSLHVVVSMVLFFTYAWRLRYYSVTNRDRAACVYGNWNQWSWYADPSPLGDHLTRFEFWLGVVLLVHAAYVAFQLKGYTWIDFWKWSLVADWIFLPYAFILQLVPVRSPVTLLGFGMFRILGLTSIVNDVYPMSENDSSGNHTAIWSGIRSATKKILRRPWNVFASWCKFLRRFKLAPIFCVLFAVTGFVHLCELSGDPFVRSNCQNIPYHKILLHIYGKFVQLDLVAISLQTVTATMVLFAVQIAFMVYAVRNAQAILEYFQKKMRPAQPAFRATTVNEYVLVIGPLLPLTLEAMVKRIVGSPKSALRKVVMLDESEPSYEHQELMKQYSDRIFFRQIRNDFDEELAQLDLAKAFCVVIVSDTNSFSSEKADHRSRARANAVKSQCSSVRIVLELLDPQSKSLLRRGKLWSTKDALFCLKSIRASLVSHNFFCPGMSTFLVNLFTGVPALLERTPATSTNGWYRTYLDNARASSIREAPLSSDDLPSDFWQLSEKYRSSGRLLGIKSRDGSVLIGPPSTFWRPQSDDVGIFVTRTPDMSNRKVEEDAAELSVADTVIPTREQAKKYQEDHQTTDNDLDRSFLAGDFTGTCYWKDKDEFRKVSAPYQNFAKTFNDHKLRGKLDDHVVLCVIADDTAAPCDIARMILLLRSKITHRGELPTVAIVAKGTYIHQKDRPEDWTPITYQLPKVFIVDNNVEVPQALAAAGVDACRLCVVVDARTSRRPRIGEEYDVVGAAGMLKQKIDESCGTKPSLLTLAGNVANFKDLAHFYEVSPSGRNFAPGELFAMGQVLSDDLLEGFLLTAVFEPHLRVVQQNILENGISFRMDEAVAEKAGMLGGRQYNHLPLPQRASTLVSKPVKKFFPYEIVPHGTQYATVLTNASKEFLCLGLLQTPEGSTGMVWQASCVMMNPAGTTPVGDADSVFGYEPSYYGKAVSALWKDPTMVPNGQPPQGPETRKAFAGLLELAHIWATRNTPWPSDAGIKLTHLGQQRIGKTQLTTECAALGLLRGDIVAPENLSGICRRIYLGLLLKFDAEQEKEEIESLPVLMVPDGFVEFVLEVYGDHPATYYKDDEIKALVEHYRPLLRGQKANSDAHGREVIEWKDFLEILLKKASGEGAPTREASGMTSPSAAGPNSLKLPDDDMPWTWYFSKYTALLKPETGLAIDGDATAEPAS